MLGPGLSCPSLFHFESVVSRPLRNAKRDQRKKKTQLSQNVLIPLLSSILFSGCLHSISLCLSNSYDSLFLANSLLSIIKVYPSICLLPPYVSLSPNSALPLPLCLSLCLSLYIYFSVAAQRTGHDNSTRYFYIDFLKVHYSARKTTPS